MDVTNYQNWLLQQWNSTALSEIREGRRKKRQLYTLDASA